MREPVCVCAMVCEGEGDLSLNYALFRSIFSIFNLVWPQDKNEPKLFHTDICILYRNIMNQSFANANVAINFSYIPDNVPSLFIPRVFQNISEAIIRKTIDKLNLGVIESVEITNKKTDKGKYKSAIIHLRWHRYNKDSQYQRESLLSGKEMNIIYDNPWFWKISAFRVNQPEVSPKITKNVIRQTKPGKDAFGRDDTLRNVGRDIVVCDKRTDAFGRDIPPAPRKQFQHPKKTPFRPVNWYDDAETDADDVDEFVVPKERFIRPPSPDHPPPQINYIEDDIYADLYDGEVSSDSDEEDEPRQDQDQYQDPQEFRHYSSYLDIDRPESDTRFPAFDLSATLPVPKKMVRQVLKK